MGRVKSVCGKYQLYAFYILYELINDVYTRHIKNIFNTLSSFLQPRFPRFVTKTAFVPFKDL